MIAFGILLANSPLLIHLREHPFLTECRREFFAQFFSTAFFGGGFIFPFLWLSSTLHLLARIAHCLYLWQVKERIATPQALFQKTSMKAHPELSLWIPLSIDWSPSGKFILPFPIFVLHWHSLPSVSKHCIGWLFSLTVLLTLILSTYSEPSFMAHCKLFISPSTHSHSLGFLYTVLKLLEILFVWTMFSQRDSFCFVFNSYWYFSRGGYQEGLHFPSSVFLIAFLPLPLSDPLSQSPDL